MIHAIDNPELIDVRLLVSYHNAEHQRINYCDKQSCPDRVFFLLPLTVQIESNTRDSCAHSHTHVF